MKGLAIVSTILLSIFSATAIIDPIHSDLFFIGKTLEANHYKVSEWSIYHKSTVGQQTSENEFLQLVKQEKQKRPNYQWTEIEDVNHHYKVVGTDQQQEYTNRIIITAVQSGKTYKVERVNEVRGNHWSEENIHQILDSIHFPTEDPSTFYTVRGKMNVPHLTGTELKEKAGKLINDFSADNVEQVIEADFLAFSGQTKKWDRKMKVQDQKEMNLQLALRYNPMEEQLNVTIGIPIITTEY